nr:IS30 family transposase [Paraburkholderia steynii]
MLRSGDDRSVRREPIMSGETNPDRVADRVRQPEANKRLIPGQWVGDLIMGAGKRSAVLTLIDRSTLFLLLIKIDVSTAQAEFDALSAAFAPLPEDLRQTMTYDQGRRMTSHKMVAETTETRNHFCNPHNSSQRGIWESSHGLLRRYQIKGTDLSVFSQHELDAIAIQLNLSPRKTLNWQSPAQVFAEECAKRDIQLDNDVALGVSNGLHSI